MAGNEQVKVDRSVAPPAPKAEQKPQESTEQWSSQYSAYTTVVLVDGKERVVKFAGNKLVLDLNDPVDKQVSQILHNSQRNHIDFEVISDNRGADISKQATTLKKLYDMSTATLARLIGADKLKACGLPSNCGDKEKLIVAFLRTNTLG